MLQYDLDTGVSELGELPPLPQEIWDAVLRNLLHDKSTLGACTLVCRSWRYTARQLLWRDVRVRHTARLSLMVQRYPEVVPLVQTLRFDLRREHEDFSWILRFSNLAALVISLEDEDTGALATNIHPSLRAPSVTSLTLLGYCWSGAAFLRIVRCFPNLQELHIDGPAAFDSDGFLEMDGPIRPARGPPLSLPRLRKLKLSALHLLPLLPSILRSAATTLKHLCLEVSTHVPLHFLSSALDLTQNTSLTRLSVITNFHYVTESWGDYVACPLATIGSAHRALSDVILHWTTEFAFSPNLIRRSRTTGIPLSANYPDPGPTLGHELSRVLEEAPQVEVMLWQKVDASQAYVTQARRDIAHKLLQTSPKLQLHSKRVKWRWSNPTSGGVCYSSPHPNLKQGSLINAQRDETRNLKTSAGPLDLFDIYNGH